MNDTIRTNDATIQTARAASEWGQVVEALAAIAVAGPKVTGFRFNEENKKQYLTAEGADQINGAATAVREAMKAAGYVKVNSAKMMGGSRTLEIFKHPARPNHKYALSKDPHTRGGVRFARFLLEVEQSWVN